MNPLPKINPLPIRGRRRFFDHLKQREFRDLLYEGRSLEEAADEMDVSIRTVERQRKCDEDFDHEVRLALQSTPDPEKLLKGHARTHWRACAWLLERTKPEHFGRRPAMSASPFQVDHALEMLLDAALAVMPPEFRSEMYRRLSAASDEAFKWVFPTYGPWGERVKTELPKTPLVTDEKFKAIGDPSNQLHVGYDDQGNVVTRVSQSLAARLGVNASTITSAPTALLTAHNKEPKANEPAAQQPAAPTPSASAPNPTPTPLSSDLPPTAYCLPPTPSRLPPTPSRLPPTPSRLPPT